MLHFSHSDSEAPPARDAATLLIVRENCSFAADGAASGAIELFFVRRHAKSPFLGGAVVFPGGKLDELDRSVPTNGLHPKQTPEGFSIDAAHGLALAVCACRESLEEAGLLPSEPALDEQAVEQLRAEVASGVRFDRALAERGVALDTRGLVPFARWITPRAESKRYDARFFMVALPPGQRGRHDDHEVVSGVWATCERMLAAFHAGDVFLAPPTLRALELLRTVASVEAALASCAEQSLLPICPTFVASDPPMLTIPGDPEHEIAELRVAGPTRFVLRDGRFVSEPSPSR
jgi:8-oxo-dGTP pyrophosphatase MutT (NUDIX family)